MSDKKVSVIIPTCNRSSLLKSCIYSLLEQTFPGDSYEIIVIDDGSTDDTGEIIQAMVKQHDRLSYFKKERGGPPSALNLGIEKARGEIIAFIDDDAIARKDWIEKAVYLLEDKKASALEGKITTMPDKISPFTHQNEKNKGGRYETINIFYTKKTLEDIGCFDEHFWDEKIDCHFRYDSDLAFRALEKGYKILFSEDVTVLNPPSEPRIKTPFQLARRYYFDALLCKKYPKLYRQNLQVFEFGNIKISKPKQKLYKLYIVSFLLLLFSSAFKNTGIFIAAATTFLFFYMGVLIIHSRMWRTGRIRPVDFMLCIPISAIIPFVYFYWLVKGMFKFKKIILW